MAVPGEFESLSDLNALSQWYFPALRLFVFVPFLTMFRDLDFSPWQSASY